MPEVQGAMLRTVAGGNGKSKCFYELFRRSNGRHGNVSDFSSSSTIPLKNEILYHNNAAVNRKCLERLLYTGMNLKMFEY